MVGSSTKLLKEYISEIVKEPRATGKRLRIFDFDDTLVKTDSKIHVTSKDGTTFDLTPGEFAVYDRQPGDAFNFDDFEQLVNPRAIKWTYKILRNVYLHHGASGVVVLSARGNSKPINQFLHDAGFSGIEVAAIGDPRPQAKVDWVNARIKRDGLTMVEYFDDSHKNVEAIKELRHQHPDVEIVTRHVMHRRIASLHA